MPTHPTTPDAVLRAVADLLDTSPGLWGRDYWLDPATGCRCSGGLIALIVDPQEQHGNPYLMTPPRARILALQAMELFERHILTELEDRYGPDGVRDIGEPLIGLWNDRIATGPAHVAETMRAAADAAVVTA